MSNTVPPLWNEADRLTVFRAYGILDTAPEPEFDDICRVAAHLCQAPIALVSLVDETRQWFKAEVGLGVCETPRDLSVCAHAILQDDFFIIPDATKDTRFRDNPLVTGDLHLRFYAGAPLRTPEGLPLGTICVLDDKPRPAGLNESQKQALTALARQVMGQLELRRAHRIRDDQEAALRESEQRYRALFERAAIGVAHVSLDGRFILVNQQLCDCLGYAQNDLLQRTFQSISDPQDLQHDLLSLKALAAGEITSFKHEKRYVRSDGSLFWGEVNVSAVRDESGAPLYWVAAIQSIGDRKAAESARRASEERLTQILNTTLVGIVELSGSGEITYANPAAELILGLSRSDIEGRTHKSPEWRISTPEGRPLTPEQLPAGRALQGETVHGDEIALEREADGNTVILSVSAVPQRSGDSIAGVLVSFTDVTARYEAEAARKSSEEFSRRILESSPDCVKILDADGNLQSMNENGMCAMEIDRFDPLRGQPWVSLWPEENRSNIEAALQAARSGSTGQFSAFCPTVKGTPKWWDVIVTPILNATGEPERILAVSRDISVLEKANETARQAENRLRLALRSGQIGAWSWDFESDVVEGDERLREIFELERSGPIQAEAFFSRTHVDDLPRVNEVVRIARESFGEYEVEFRVVLPKGSMRWVIARGVVTKTTSGSGLMMIGTTWDITDRKEAEEELKAANQEVQRFAYIVSHDLRAPLVNVMGFTSELESTRKDLDAFYRSVAAQAPSLLTPAVRAAFETDLPEAIRFIRSSTAKMDWLINAILQLSREGQRPLAPEAIRMEPLLIGYRETLAHQLSERSAELTIEAVPDLISDKLAIEQIFGNLIENAVKYLDPGRPGRVVVRGREAGPNVRYEVEDNGRGIERKDFERIFDLFRRAGIQDQRGEGIGLAHVRALVRRLGGSIAVASEPGVGSTFTVTLPKVLSASLVDAE